MGAAQLGPDKARSQPRLCPISIGYRNEETAMHRPLNPAFSKAGTLIAEHQLHRISGGETAIKPAPQIPQYVPLSQSHPKVERDLTRVSYR